MSTYLVAMMVGDFVCKSGAADGIPIRVCTVPGKENLVGWALTSAENILKFYDTYYYTKYPFQKLDIIAFPDSGWRHGKRGGDHLSRNGFVRGRKNFATGRAGKRDVSAGPRNGAPVVRRLL